MNTPFKWTLAVMAALALTAGARAQDTRPFVQWAIPALPTNVPQTPEQTKAGQLNGRELPPPPTKTEPPAGAPRA